jgi:hypothetical protein
MIRPLLHRLIEAARTFRMSSVFNNEDQVRGALLRKPSEKNYVLPGINRIILVRHGESLGNVDESAYATTADWKIPITERGREQARMAGKSIANQLGEKGKIFFYFSPYLRTRQTLREILREIDKECIVGMREEPRM